MWINKKEYTNLIDRFYDHLQITKFTFTSTELKLELIKRRLKECEEERKCMELVKQVEKGKKLIKNQKKNAK